MEKYMKIQQAILANNAEEVKKALEQLNVAIYCLDEQCRVPLLGLAIEQKCSIDIVKELIDNRCLVNEGINHESLSIDINPLVLACKNKNYQAMELLIKAGAIVDVRGFTGTPLIHLACKHNLNFVKLLVENGADPHALSTGKNSVLHAAVAFRASYEVFHYLLKCGVNPTEKNTYGDTPLSTMDLDPSGCDPGIKVMMKMAVEQRKSTSSLSLKRKLEIKNSPSEKAKADLEKDAKKGRGIEQSVVSAYKKLKASQMKRSECLKESIATRKTTVKYIDTETKIFGTSLECPICFIDFTKESVILQCFNGHVLCHVCHQKIKACPQCKVSFNQKISIRNRVLENIINGMHSERSL